MSLDVLTFGCRLNTTESQVIRREAHAAGLKHALIINTCAVTSEAVRQARQAIRRAKREQPERRIIVTGCAAQTEPAMFAAMDEVDQVIGNEEKMKTASYAPFGLHDAERSKISVSDIMAVTDTAPHMVDAIEGRARAFVQVQNGCDHRCTFCIIPYGRGNSRSVAMGAVVQDVRRLVENGYNEIVITGVDITSYGADLPGAPKLGALIKSIFKHVPDLKRLRLSSIDSIEADPDLIDAFAHEARLMPHLHLSLQHGDDMILKRMKRRHLRKDTIAFCKQIKCLRPDVAFGADIIAGFPTETEEMFQNSLRIVDECELAHLHVFPYSARQGTPAARMPPVHGPLIKERAARLREQGKTVFAAHLRAQLGTSNRALVEREGLARIEQFTSVRVEPHHAAGGIIPIQITGIAGNELVGVELKSTPAFCASIPTLPLPFSGGGNSSLLSYSSPLKRGRSGGGS